MSDYQEISDYQKKYQKIRKQLIGFATLLIIMAIVAPWIITNKSKKQGVTKPQEHSIDLIKGTENKSNEVANSLDNIDVVNVPRLPDKITDLNTEPESVAKVAPQTKQVSTVSKVEQDKIAKAASEKSSKTKSTQVDVSAAKLKSTEKKYTIQLVALKNKQKIDELTALLLLHNYNVQVIPKNPEPNQVIKLQLGPYAKKEQAEQVIIDLKNLTKLKGNILNN